MCSDLNIIVCRLPWYSIDSPCIQSVNHFICNLPLWVSHILHYPTIHDPEISLYQSYPLYDCRGRFEGICSSLWRKCLEPIDVILNKAELHQDAIGHVSYMHLCTDEVYIEVWPFVAFISSKVTITNSVASSILQSNIMILL